jgi:YlmC/YmxH family sporulation protein
LIKISDLRTREVINVADGRRLGAIADIDLDLNEGRVTAFIMPGGARGFSLFRRREEVVVPWDKVVVIGKDVILVNVPAYTEISAQNTRYYADDDDL